MGQSSNPLRPPSGKPVGQAKPETKTSAVPFAFGWAISWLGFRVKAPLTTRQLSTAVSVLAEGCALRDRLRSADIRDIKLPTGTKGRRESWTLFGIGLEALCQHFLEEIPSWEPGPINF